MAKQSTSIFLDDQLKAKIKLRGDQSHIIRRDLDRIYYAIDKTLVENRIGLTIDEACLIVDASNGTLYDPWSIGALDGEVADSIALDHTDTKWEIDGKALVAKLQGASYAEKLALVDSAERYWTAHPGISEFRREEVAAAFRLPF